MAPRTAGSLSAGTPAGRTQADTAPQTARPRAAAWVRGLSREFAGRRVVDELDPGHHPGRVRGADRPQRHFPAFLMSSGHHKADAEIFRHALSRHPAGAITHLICAAHARITVGDRELLVGRVEHAIPGSGEPPLVHHQGRLTRTEPGCHHDG